MTEKKRFNLVGSYLYDGDECVSHFDDPKHREEIVNLLNNYEDKYTSLLVDYNGLGCEYDELKQQNKMLRTNIEKLTGDVKYLQTLPSEHRELYKQSEAKRVNLLKENEQLKSRIDYLEMKIERERKSSIKQNEKWEKEALEKINELTNENNRIKNIITEALANERTQLGQSVLRQLWEAIQ